MSQRKPCKYFAQGACWRGDHCKFVHERKEPQPLSRNVMVCTFYQKGNCTYGSRCKYEHVKSSWVASGGAAGASSSSMSPHQSVILSSVPACAVSSRNSKKEDRPLCSFDVAGDCPHGDKCSFVHGDLCPTCGKHSLHPFRADEREEHLKSCEKNQKFHVAVKQSEEIECCVCLDRVLSKPTAAERKFAVLPECDHPFCISCIRNWRNGSPASGMALRACPICRKTSHFVIPSLIWYSCKEEKQEIIDTYKARLRKIDCKHFNFGNGNCPFSINCFYKHTVMPGSYTWKHHKPPPRRPPPRRRSNAGHMDSSFDYLGPAMEDFLDLFDDDYLDYDNYCDPFHEGYQLDIFDYEDYLEEEHLSPFDMALLLAGMDCGGASDISSDEDDFY
ncbi:hypothetical protein OIU84_014769 [Salix udensis]|uniref:RING-type E3 ubiquitin transferase n=1 Tax=Salix udensis TaxID=889485 RepID=A0AAD6NRR3_9ROSI|nr:hypothetical protein OIU84_014769 [Salix udensis]